MKHKRGSVLVATLGFVLVFTLLGLSSIYLGTVQNEAAEKQIASTKAFWLEEAGLQKALWEIKHHNCQGLKQKANLGTYCSSCDSCGTGNKVLAATVAGYGDYDIVVNRLNTVATSTGSFPSRTFGHPLFSQRAVRLGSSVFDHALFAQNKLTIKNNVEINSYDSTVGPYDPGAVNHNGNVGSNGTGTAHDPIIEIFNNVDVYGDVSTGGNGTGYVDYRNNVTAGNPNISCAGNPSPCADNDTHDNNVTLPAVVVPPFLKNLASSGNITNTSTLSAGDYKYESIDLTNNKTLTINGKVNLYLTGAEAFHDNNNFKLILTPDSKVVIYVDGRFILSNNTSVNNDREDSDNNGIPDGTGHPADFQVFSTYTTNHPVKPGVFLQNNGVFNGAIYAPETNIQMENNGGVFGSLVGEEILVQGSNNKTISYDESLAGEFAFLGKWQEI